MTWQSRLGCAVLVTLAWVAVATAAIMVSEVGDAGGLPGTAQIITENVTFNNRDIEISGEIEGAADEDMYGFEISVPSVFSAQDVSVSE